MAILTFEDSKTKFSVEIPEYAINAICVRFGREETIIIEGEFIPNPQSKEDFFFEHLTKELDLVTREHLIDVAIEQAKGSVADRVIVPDPTIAK